MEYQIKKVYTGEVIVEGEADTFQEFIEKNKDKLYRANLIKVDLSNLDLSGANLAEANLLGANLSDTNLSGANLFKATLVDADLSGANLIGANLSGANLHGAKLSSAKILLSQRDILLETLDIGLINSSEDFMKNLDIRLNLMKDIVSKLRLYIKQDITESEIEDIYKYLEKLDKILDEIQRSV
jgi:phosphatidylinositol kinase/protein kinase (PI-3  family)